MLPETDAFFRRICRRVYVGNQNQALLRLGWLSIVALRLFGKHYNALYTNGQGNSIVLFAKMIASRGTWVHHHHTAGDEAEQPTWGPQYRQALQQADTVIACSCRNAENLRLATDRAINVIPCFSRQVQLPADLRQVSPKLHFGYYGRLIPEKGIDLICQLSDDPELAATFEFHLWGQGKAYQPAFFNQFAQLNYHGPFRGKDDLAVVLGSLDAVLLLSSHPEGLPISLLEAMGAGVPWLATDRGGIPDIACDPNSTRIIPINSTYLQTKAAILSFAADIRGGKVSSVAQREMYTRQFSSQALVSQWRKVFGLQEL